MKYLTKEAETIMRSRRGYRDDTLFPLQPELPTDRHDPCDVVFTEVIGCGKYEICDFILMNHMDTLSRIDYRFLADVVYRIRTGGSPALDQDERTRFRGIIGRITGHSGYCVWLCSSPEHIYDYYLNDYIPRADRAQPGFAHQCPDYDKKRSLSKEDYIAQYVKEYTLSDSAVLLCDLGIQGVLAAW